jgi:quercetin dioxygenase-like cupin family protein
LDYCEWVENQRDKTPSMTSWDSISPEVVSDPQVSTHAGTIRKSWVGNNVVLTSVVVKSNSVGKMHVHQSEQVSMLVRGRVRVTLGDKEFIAEAGSIVHIPGNVPHKFEILDEEAEIFDVYSVLSSAEELRKAYV